MSKQITQDYEYYITTVSDNKGLVRFYSFGNKSDKPIIANINCEYGAINTQLFNTNQKSEFSILTQYLESSNAKLLINLNYYTCDSNY